MRGRKPKPSYLKVLDGNAGRRPLNEDEPQAKAPLTREPPHWFSEGQREIFLKAVADAPDGLLKDLDESTFVGWCVAYDNFRQASDAVNRYGQFVKGPGGRPSVNPALAVQNKQNLIMVKLAAEMGFTPSSRSRVKIDAAKGKGQANQFAALRTFGEE